MRDNERNKFSQDDTEQDYTDSDHNVVSIGAGNRHSAHGAQQHSVSHDDDDEDSHGGGGGGGGHGSDEFLWLFSFNDMLFNLLLFFIVMFAISSVNKSKFEAVAEALSYPKDSPAGTSNQPLFFEKENIETSVSKDTATDVYVECANPLTTPTGSATGQSTLAPPPGQIGSAADETKFTSKVIVLSGNEYFRPAEPEPTARGLRLVKKLAKIYAKQKRLVQVQIEGYGYLDEFPERALNLQRQTQAVQAWGLSAQRAASILGLMTEEGFDSNIISIVGVGPGSKEHLSVNSGPLEEKQKRPKVIIRLTESDHARGEPAAAPQQGTSK